MGAAKGPGWNPDPSGLPGKFRWWDGQQWTQALSETLWAPAPRAAPPYQPDAPLPTPTPMPPRPVHAEIEEDQPSRRPKVIGVVVAVALVLGAAVGALSVLRGPATQNAASDGSGKTAAAGGSSGTPGAKDPAATTTTPVETPGSSPRPPGNPAPGIPPPLMPALAAKSGATGAKAFVRYYWDVYSYGLQTGNWIPFRRLSDPGCGFCDDLSRPAPDDPMLGRSWSTGETHVEFSRGKATISVAVTASAAKATPGAGTPTGKPETWWYEMKLVYTKTGWRVSSVA